jgi:hypothetical protein
VCFVFPSLSLYHYYNIVRACSHIDIDFTPVPRYCFFLRWALEQCWHSERSLSDCTAISCVGLKCSLGRWSVSEWVSERGSGLMSEHSLFDDFRVAYYHVIRMCVRVCVCVCALSQEEYRRTYVVGNISWECSQRIRASQAREGPRDDLPHAGGGSRRFESNYGKGNIFYTYSGFWS